MGPIYEYIDAHGMSSGCKKFASENGLTWVDMDGSDSPYSRRIFYDASFDDGCFSGMVALSPEGIKDKLVPISNEDFLEVLDRCYCAEGLHSRDRFRK